jgi:hypothetical protein
MPHFNPSINTTHRASMGLETNGKGVIGFIIELPGGFVRGRTETEALHKTRNEVKSYLKWLGISAQDFEYDTEVVQRHISQLVVEDGDNEILLHCDEGEMVEEEFKEFIEIVAYSGQTLAKLYSDAKLKDWVDEMRARKTFYGENPKDNQRDF